MADWKHATFPYTEGNGVSNLALRGWILFEGEQFVVVVLVLFSAQGNLGGQVRQGA